MQGDTNDDGFVDIVDLNNVRNNFGATGQGVLGDTNWDEVVDIVDLNNVRNNFGLNWSEFPSAPGAQASSPLVASPPSTGSAGLTTSNQPTPPPTGIEVMRAALADYYHSRVLDPNSPDTYDDLIGWDLLGDETWWADLLSVA